MQSAGRQLPRPNSNPRSGRQRPPSAGPTRSTDENDERNLGVRPQPYGGKNLSGVPPPAPGQKPRGGPGCGVGSCVVCKLEPLVFRECPKCNARYCSSGCLQSWYEHCRPSRQKSITVPVICSEQQDYITCGPWENLEDP